jgi:hypothetical protein
MSSVRAPFLYKIGFEALGGHIIDDANCLLQPSPRVIKANKLLRACRY